MKSDTPVFKNVEELANTFDALRQAPPSRKKDVTKGKATRTFFDLFDNLRQAKSKEEFDRLLKKSKLLSDLTQGKKDARGLINIKLNPSLGHITDDEGHVQVGGREFDVLNEDDARELMRMMPEPVPDFGDGDGGSGGGTPPAYIFTENPPEDWVIFLPCGPWTVLPGYPTNYLPLSLPGDFGDLPLVVQLWKGSCPDFFGWAESPGGVGAEVGLYVRDPWMPHLMWWPLYLYKQMIEFTLINPVTGVPFFSASSPNPIWWSHKWMKFPSYDQYVRDQQHKVPSRTEDYILRYRIGAMEFQW
jgi:hypothetical protein